MNGGSIQCTYSREVRTEEYCISMAVVEMGLQLIVEYPVMRSELYCCCAFENANCNTVIIYSHITS